MLDVFGFPQAQTGDVQVFGPNTTTATPNFTTWQKPRGVNMVGIFLLSRGGTGTNGSVGASGGNGGSGGGSSGQTVVLIPAMFLPNALYVSVQYGNSSGTVSKVAIAPDNTATNCLALANGPPSTVAGAIATIATMPLAGMGFFQLLAGQVAPNGNSAAGSSVAIPTTGLRVTAGACGGGMQGLNGAGQAGGGITGSGVFPTTVGGAGVAGGTNTKGGDGGGLFRPIPNLGFYYGGTGGASQSLDAVGGPAGGGAGAPGGPGCGGGGSGSGFTGSTAAPGGRGGDGQCVILAW